MVDNVPHCPRWNEAKGSESGIMLPRHLVESHFPDAMFDWPNVWQNYSITKLSQIGSL